METLNDLGTVEYFGVNTFTTGIYRTCLGMGERSAAAQLAAFLMVFILILIVLDDASWSLGYGSTSTLWKIHTPLMSGGLLISAMLVFVDVMKELPATLFIRPFNFDTLGIRVYQYASDERLAEAAAPALAIVLVGIIPVIFLSWRITQGKRI